MLSSGIYPTIASRFDPPPALMFALLGLTLASFTAGVIVMPKAAELKRSTLRRKGYLRTSVAGTKNPWVQILVGSAALLLALGVAAPLLAGFLDGGPSLSLRDLHPVMLGLAAIPLLYVVLSVLAIARGAANLDVGRMMRDEPNARAVDEQGSGTPSSPSLDASERPGQNPAPFKLETTSTLPEAANPTTRASPEENVYGDPPLRLLFLWNFDVGLPQKRWWLRRERWLGLGPVYMLSTADRIPLIRYLRLRMTGRLREAFVVDGTALDRQLAEFDERPLSPGLRNGRYGRYPTLELLCTSASWRGAVRRLCDHADAVVLDARGYTEESPGLSWELGTLTTWVPADRFIILADITTEVSRLERELKAAWETLPPDSPNYGSGLPIRVLNTAGNDVEGSLAEGQGEIVHKMYDAGQVLPYLRP